MFSDLALYSHTFNKLAKYIKYINNDKYNIAW